MKRLVISGAVAALIAGGAGLSFADGSGPSLNGNNNYGLCTAYEAQSAHNPNGPSAPFQQLAQNYQNSSSTGQSFDDYCKQLLGDGTPGNSTGSHTNHGGH